MGVPVAGKNLFPSNIEGLPTWFTVRANEAGWMANRKRTDVMVAMNDDTVGQDIRELEPGAILILDDKLRRHRDVDQDKLAELSVVAVPFAKLVTQVCDVIKLRKKIVNVIYVGVLAYLLDIDMEEVNAAIDHQFGKKPSAAKMNKDAAQAGFDWARHNALEKAPFRIERRNLTANQIIIEGNEATAMGLMFGGVSVVAWYPITPSSSVCEALNMYLNKFRRDPETGKATFAVVQAEDEIASIGMVLGAGWAGARACTATAGPGISLMGEMAGLSYFAEIPAVIVDVQRMGPSTGLPTRTSQGDILKAYYLSHGDCKHPMLIPASVEECYEFGKDALDYAERLQTLVFVMSDLDLGMNKWLSDAFVPPQEPITRGKILSAEDVERLGGFERYGDVDGDGIGYRTLPGTDHPKAAYFTRGTGHKPNASYSEDPDVWQANMDRLARKFETARNMMPGPIVDENGHDIGIIAYGSSDPAVAEARHYLQMRHGIATDYLRIRALPAHASIQDFIKRHRVTYVIDQNRDRQMLTLLRSEWPETCTKLGSIRHYNGMPIDAESIVSGFIQQERHLSNGKDGLT